MKEIRNRKIKKPFIGGCTRAGVYTTCCVGKKFRHPPIWKILISLNYFTYLYYFLF